VDLGGKVALVTGGTKGIGRAIVEALVENGARVAFAARTEQDVEQAQREIGESARGFVTDVSDAAQCERLVQQTVDAFDGLEILVNNAGLGIFASVAEMSVEQWDTVLHTNLDGVFYLTHHAIPHLKGGDGGWVINIASLAGKNAFPGGAAYSASKFGLVGFSEALMQDVRHDGIRVSYIMPGSVATHGFGEGDWKIQPEDIGRIVLDLLATPDRTLPSRIEVRPSRPPKS